jgi:hypothetical protein
MARFSSQWHIMVVGASGLEVHDYDASIDDYEILLSFMAYLWWRLSWLPLDSVYSDFGGLCFYYLCGVYLH